MSDFGGRSGEEKLLKKNWSQMMATNELKTELNFHTGYYSLQLHFIYDQPVYFLYNLLH